MYFLIYLLVYVEPTWNGSNWRHVTVSNWTSNSILYVRHVCVSSDQYPSCAKLRRSEIINPHGRCILPLDPKKPMKKIKVVGFQGNYILIYFHIHKPCIDGSPKSPLNTENLIQIFENWIITGSYFLNMKWNLFWNGKVWAPWTCICVSPMISRFPFLKWCNHLWLFPRWGCAWIVESKMARVQGSTSMESSARRGAVFFGVDGRRFFRATGFVFWWFRKTMEFSWVFLLSS